MQIHLIWAQDQNGGIGKNGKLPWHITEDLKNFKKLTINSTVLMGRKTWESLPKQPLPDRRNIVLTSTQIPDLETFDSIETCIETLDNDGVTKVFIIGGAQVYRNFIHRADELHITLVNEETEGIDIYFPVSMLKIKEEFEPIEETELRKGVVYSQWVRK